MASFPLRLVLASLILLAAACGGDDGGESSESIDEPTATASSSTSSTTTAPVIGPPTSRGLPDPVAVDPLPADLGSISVLGGEPPYRGVLGQVDPGRVVVQPVALPPADLGAGVAPLTGLAAADAEARPAILVKIDNTSKGRPQESLNRADLVYEEMIEGGFTRLAAVFHTEEPLLGPVRSGRTTDIALLGSLDRPVFAWSGANLVHAALLRRQDMVDLGAATRREYFRAGDRPGTYNLMTEAATLNEIAAELGETGAPPPHFEYRDETIGLPSTAVEATEVGVSFPSARASWSWTGDGWARTQNDEPHVDASDEQVVAANVVVAEVAAVPTGSVDTAGSTVREQVFLGAGRGWVFTDGHAVEVTWTKPSISSVATWTTPDGIPVALTPGITWVELVPVGGVTFS